MTHLSLIDTQVRMLLDCESKQTKYQKQCGNLWAENRAQDVLAVSWPTMPLKQDGKYKPCNWHVGEYKEANNSLNSSNSLTSIKDASKADKISAYYFLSVRLHEVMIDSSVRDGCWKGFFITDVITYPLGWSMASVTEVRDDWNQCVTHCMSRLHHFTWMSSCVSVLVIRPEAYIKYNSCLGPKQPGGIQKH